jgi:sugar (pentulose or hexulose) kinase
MLAVAAGTYPDPRGGIGSGRHFAPGLWGHFGEVSNGGISLEWARRLLTHGDHDPLELSRLDTLLARSRAGSDGLSFFPFFDGTSPYDESESSRASFLGLSLSHEHPQVLRAVTEGVAYSMRMLLDGYRGVTDAAAGTPVVVGGAVRSREWMQLLADILRTDLRVSSEPDAACVGAAILAAVAAGDVRSAVSGSEQMAVPTVTISPDGPSSCGYDDLFATYACDARGLSELYAAREG